MKTFTILLDCLGITSAAYLFHSYSIIAPLPVAALMLLSLIVLSGLGNRTLALILLILNVCVTCGSTVLLGIILLGDVMEGYPLSVPLALFIVTSYILVAVMNILTLKEPAGIKKTA